MIIREVDNNSKLKLNESIGTNKVPQLKSVYHFKYDFFLLFCTLDYKSWKEY